MKKRISVKDLSKSFRIGQGDTSILERIVGLFSGKENKRSMQVLDGITFDAQEGEIIGIIGKNGSGKSTLLRIIAGIYVADWGEKITDGEIMYINGFNHGIKPRLTMKENIFLVGSILGLKRDEVKAKFDEIVDFADLREFVDTKVYQFSSGMAMRLNFSIFMHCVSRRPLDILLLDEILGAAGDLEFKMKAEAKMQELVKSGATVLLVSHNLQDIQKLCSRAIWIEDGKMRADGLPSEVIESYRRR